MIRHISIFFIPLLLSGCMGIYEGGFECPPGEGTKCKSISEVNELVNKGEIPLIQPPGSSTGTCCPVNEEAFLHAIQKPTIWWAPWSHQETRSSTQPQRDKGYGTQPL